MIKELILIPDKIAVCKLNPDIPLPKPSGKKALWSLSVTAEEVSLVCSEGEAPVSDAIEGGWRAFMVKGPLDFSLTGIVANLTQPLAKALIPVFIISTFDADYLLVKEKNLGKAKKILSKEWVIAT
jgi:hypothetical protein